MATVTSGNPCTGAGVNQCPGWVDQLLTALGAPLSWNNRRSVWLWAASEGNGVAHNNPFNISGGGPGATGCYSQCGGSSPVTGFATMQDGINATANFIKNGYNAIWKAFVANQGEVAIWQAINESKWCRGCQDGHYPNVLQDDIQGQATPTTGFGSLIPGGGAAQPGTGGTGLGANPPSNCAWQGPLGWCIVTRSQLKAVKGAAFIATGGLLMLAGGTVLVAFAFQASGAGKAARQVATKTPLGRVVKAGGQRRQARRTEAVRQTRRAERQTDAENAAARRRYAAGGGSSGRSGPAERPFGPEDETGGLPTPAQRMNRARVASEERQRAARRSRTAA